MSWLVKIKAGSLQFVLFIGAVIAVLLLTFVLLAHSHMLFSKKTDKYIETIQRTDLALELSLRQQGEDFSIVSNYLPNDGIEVEMTQDSWGIFEVYKVTSSFQKTSFTKTALVGGKLQDDNTALYLKDNERPMIIVGNAKIKGDTYLPKQGIRPGNISGQSFYGKTLVLGKQKLSHSSLPNLNVSVRATIETLLSNYTYVSKTNIFDSAMKDELSNSFLEPTIIIQDEALNLTGKTITGNIILKANKRIVIDASSKLTDVILVAPEIMVKDGVKGAFQAVASKKISIGKNCELKYPSALVVQQNDKKLLNVMETPVPNIEINDNTVIKGVVCYLSESVERAYHPQIKIHKNTAIMGQVYCEKNLELKGSIWGYVTTDSFIAMENGSVYQNHLFQGTIDRTVLPNQYVGLGFGQSNEKDVSKWLY